MTTDERLAKLETMQEKNQVLAGQILESIMRLERIALSHELRIQDLDAKLAELEGRTRKPQ